MTTTKPMDDGGPAFPAKVSVDRNTNKLLPHQFGNDDFCTPGLSLRDYFAAKAMQGMLSTANASCLNGLDGYEEITAKAAYTIADAMLNARQEKDHDH